MKALNINGFVINVLLEKVDINKLEKYFVIMVEKDGKVNKAEIIGSYYTPDDNFVLPAGKNVLIVLNDRICLFSPDNMRITKKVTIDIIGTMLGVYSYNEDFILHGEVEIVRINRNLDVIWKYSGIDLFVSKDNEEAIIFKEDSIYLKDFSDNHYEIGYNGVLKKFIRKE